MANKLGSENRFPIVRMLGVASPPSTPPTDELHLFVDEATKSLWWIDDTGALVDLAAGAIADILDLPTAETDDTLVLAPDGAGGVEFRAEAGGSSLATVTADAIYTGATNGTSHGQTIASAAAGKRIIVVVSSYNRDVNTPTCTNVTFTEVLAATFGSGAYLSIYVGVVSGGSSGTTVTVTATGSNWILADVYVVGDALTPTAGVSGTTTDTSAAARAGLPVGNVAAGVGAFFIVGVAQNDGSTGFSGIGCTSPTVQASHGLNAGVVSAIGRAHASHVSAWYFGGTSGGDMAAGIVVVS